MIFSSLPLRFRHYADALRHIRRHYADAAMLITPLIFRHYAYATLILMLIDAALIDVMRE